MGRTIKFKCLYSAKDNNNADFEEVPFSSNIGDPDMDQIIVSHEKLKSMVIEAVNNDDFKYANSLCYILNYQSLYYLILNS